ncbi:site-specific integrase [Acinetobacter schindleri]|uniref:tyrosine-type recombinase/integrase n=1 Tax=Acinetobacter schindleri TaxID=108981 RepID=UPI00209AC497|nr:site-specific integrase [Acinetobacter schindleri]MCO8068616.1 site-specific integrase [Acinetobacter schindleri]
MNKTVNHTQSFQTTQEDSASPLVFSQLMDKYLAKKKDLWQPSTYAKVKQAINKHLIPVFGNRPIISITSKEWFEFFSAKQVNEQIYNQVNKLISLCIGAYDLAKFKGEINHNPLQNIRIFLEQKPSNRMKHIDIHELPDLIACIRDYSQRSAAIALELLIHLFPRPIDLRTAKWVQFDFENDIWTNVVHVVPLSTHVKQLLSELKELSGSGSEYLFPSNKNIHKPMSDGEFKLALNNLGYKGRQTLFGFRYLAAMHLYERFSDRGFIIAAALGHVTDRVRSAHFRNTYIKERAEVMQWWSDYIESLLK